MVIKKAISPRVLVAVSIVSLFLIAGSIYLHLQQKHHLGRMNSSNRRVKTTEGVENLSNDDVIHVPQIASNSPGTKSNNFTGKSDNDYDDMSNDDSNLHGHDYPNDATSTTNSQEVKSKDHNVAHKSSTAIYLMDNDYSTDLDIEYANPTSGDAHLNSTDKLGLNQHCFHCLCMTVNGCKPFKCAHIDPCGIYGISKYYWLDGGSSTTTVENDNDYGEENQAHIDYLRCVNNENCAKETVRNYIKRYQRDCNNDGVIDCQDHIALHILGPSGCNHKQLSPIRRMRIKTCLK